MYTKLVELTSGGAEDSVRYACELEGTPYDKLVALTEALLAPDSIAMRHWGFLLVQAGASEAVPETAKLIYRENAGKPIERLIPLLLEGQQAGQFVREDPRMLAIAYFSMIQGLGMTRSIWRRHSVSFCIPDPQILDPRRAMTRTARRPLIAVDTLGGPGKSVPGPAYYKSMDDVRWIDEILDYQKLPFVHVAGVSNGAYLASLYTSKRPERVGRAVCMAGGIERSLWRMLLLFLPEALFPTKRSTIRLLNKMSGPNLHAYVGNAELMEQWQALLRYFNNRSMTYHPYRRPDRADLAVLREKA